MDFSIIIPTKDRGAILRQTLNHALEVTKGSNVEFLIINDGQEEIILGYPEATNIRIYKNTKSGVASARNLGAHHARYNHLIFMDDDMWMRSDNLNILETAITLYPNSCINLNWIYPPELTLQISKQKFGRYLEFYGFTSLKGWNRGAKWDSEKIFETEGITSQFLYISKVIFNQVGGYNENFPHAGFEDYDFAQRLRAKGIQFYIAPMSFLYHNEADRVTIKNWLARKRRGAETRRFAVLSGYKNLEIHYSLFKKLLYCSCIKIYPVLFWIEMTFPNKKKLDKLYFRFVNLLLGVHSFEGYQKK